MGSRFLVIGLFLVLTSSQKKEVDKLYMLGQFNQQDDSRFIQLLDEHTAGAARGQYLRREAYEAFQKMALAASRDGVRLTIISATRNFTQQKRIWERKWQAETSIVDPVERARKILLYSSMPGTSRHHWGTDIDLNSLENSYFESGEGLMIYEWLQQHASSFGFCQPYTTKANGRTGYEEEKWHWSFTPLSVPLLKSYKQQISYTDITGFRGSEIASRIQVISTYVDGVSCR